MHGIMRILGDCSLLPNALSHRGGQVLLRSVRQQHSSRPRGDEQWTKERLLHPVRNVEVQGAGRKEAMRNVNEMTSNAGYAQSSSLQAGESLQGGWCIISHVPKLVLFLLFLGSKDSFLSKKDKKSCCNSQWNSQQRKSQHQSRNEDSGLCEYSANQAYESYLNLRNYGQCCKELMCWRFELHPSLSSSLAFTVCHPDDSLLCFCFMPIPFSYFWFTIGFSSCFFFSHTFCRRGDGWNTTESEQCFFLSREENVCSFCPSSCCEVFSGVYSNMLLNLQPYALRYLLPP